MTEEDDLLGKPLTMQKRSLVAMVKAFQRGSVVQNMQWGVFADNSPEGKRDPGLQTASSLRTFIRQYNHIDGVPSDDDDDYCILCFRCGGLAKGVVCHHDDVCTCASCRCNLGSQGSHPYDS